MAKQTATSLAPDFHQDIEELRETYRKRYGGEPINLESKLEMEKTLLSFRMERQKLSALQEQNEQLKRIADALEKEFGLKER